jgi:hypothetical protein
MNDEINAVRAAVSIAYILHNNAQIWAPDEMPQPAHRPIFVSN